MIVFKEQNIFEGFNNDQCFNFLKIWKPYISITYSNKYKIVID